MSALEDEILAKIRVLNWLHEAREERDDALLPPR